MPDGAQPPVRADYLTRFSSTRQPENHGRPRVFKDRLTTDFIRELANDFAENGANAIKNVREQEPAQYLRVVASLVPKELEVRRPLSGIDDDKLAEILAILQATQIDAVAMTVEEPEAIQ